MLLRIKKLEKKSSLILHDGRRHDDELIGFISLCFFFKKKNRYTMHEVFGGNEDDRCIRHTAQSGLREALPWN
jgi:hypothetical protein